ncbi:MAG: hypothetical protein HUJ27_00140 [Rhodobacteraceae bacterium]|nr:hypothetical protein [Paracoccaceae bacterium]
MILKTAAAAVLAMLLAMPAHAQGLSINGIDFGMNDSEYADDGECDDPRFVGDGMAESLDQANTMMDAFDCAVHFQEGNIRPQRTKAEWDIAECRAIDYGDNSSQWARDDECDDPRFTGPGADEIMVPEDFKADATDCRALCTSGQVWLK